MNIPKPMSPIELDQFDSRITKQPKQQSGAIILGSLILIGTFIYLCAHHVKSKNKLSKTINLETNSG